MIIRRAKTGFWSYFPWASAVLLLTAGILLASAVSQQEDPLQVIKARGASGMKLRGGQTVVVENNRLYVRSGTQVRPLFPDQATLTITRNNSQLPQKDIQDIALNLIRTQISGPYGRSYKVHAAFDLKGSQGNVRTVLCRLVFEHRNIWYAEERTLELDVTSSGGTHRLTKVRPLTAEAPARDSGLKAVVPRAKLAIKTQPPALLAAQKRQNFKLDSAALSQIVKKYPRFESVPVYELAKEFRVPIGPLGPSAKGLANTAYPEVVTADEATSQVHLLMQIALGSAAKLVGPAESSKDAVLNYLRNDGELLAWNNIGHGNPSTIFQNGTNIEAADLAAGTFQGLNGCVCLVNSCQTFNDPLKAALLAHGPRTFMAGVINLPMVTSEGSNPNFWFKALFEHKAMSVAFTETNNESGLTGYWGFWGDSGIF